ncbi:hypothetical protein WJX75_003093 [Coccomyxa subellipsoidea]|uniref:RING-type domain-containing protein n=1 Tax=Coccomyxa subellipsoidea TaxID=248742 RepID=A0ABR2YBQ8_9CHLO
MGNTGSTRSGAKALASAAAAGDFDGAREIITASPAAWLNTFGGQAPLMRACMYGSPQHVECVAYLLVHGADVYAQTSRGDNALHIAAKHGNAGCLHALLSSRPQTDSEGGTVLLGDVLVQGDTGPTKLIDLHNGSGLTALHLAAIKGSVAVVRALVRAGASLDAPTLSGVLNPNLSRGSTALHIAAARGHTACVCALLESQAAIPGMELQRIRNARGLKASQLARLAGHHSVARLLSEAHISPAALSGGHTFADTPRQPRRSAHTRPEQQQAPPQQQRSRGGSAGPERHQVSQEAVIGAIVQRAKLLLSLRAVSLQTESGCHAPGDAASEEAALNAVAAEVSEALRSKGPNGQPTESLSTLLGLLASLTDSTSPAALNAMAAGVQGPQPLTFLTPTSSAAAALAVQAALKKLSSSRHGTRTLVSAGLPDQASTSGSLHRQASNMSVRSAGTVASVGASSSRSGRRHRRQHGLRQTLSGTLTRHGSASEMLSAMTAGHTAAASVSRRRRHSHRCSGSSGSVSALILSPTAPRSSAAPSPSVGPTLSAALQLDVLETAAAPASQQLAPVERGHGEERTHAAVRGCNGTPTNGLLEGGVSLSEASEAGAWLSASPAASPAHLSLLPFQTREGPAYPHASEPHLDELLGSDSLPSSPFGESRAGDALLHSSDNALGLVSSGGEAAHSSPDSLFARGRFMQTSDVAELLQTSCSGHGQPARHGEWNGPVYGRGRWSSHGQESIMESCDIEAILGDENPPSFVTLNSEQLAAWSQTELSNGMPTDSVQPSTLTLPLLEDHPDSGLSGARDTAPPPPSSAAAQVAQAFGRHLSFRGRGEGKGPNRHAGKGKERASAKAWTEMCAICMDASLEISIGGCGHSLCSRCAYQLCARGLAAPVCPFCRGVIHQFEPMLSP